MSYSSKINIRLSETPKTTDEKIFPDLVDIYNAIHILAQYVDAVAGRGDNPAGTLPYDSMPFKDWLWIPAARAISQGEVVTVVNHKYILSANGRPGDPVTRLEGVIPGAASRYTLEPQSLLVTSRTYPVYSSITGLALEDCAAGDLCKVGIGPAVIKSEGLIQGTPVYAWDALRPAPGGTWPPMPPANATGYVQEVGDGAMFTIPDSGVAIPSNRPYRCVGRGVAQDSMMFCGPGWYWPDEKLIWTPINSGGGGFNNS